MWSEAVRGITAQRLSPYACVNVPSFVKSHNAVAPRVRPPPCRDADVRLRAFVQERVGFRPKRWRGVVAL